MGEDKISQLIKSFREITSKMSYQPTFMEIAGYPHYENVCSNILAYYLDIQAPHGLGDMCLKSLLSTISCHEGQCNVVIEREVSTFNGNRIDLLIKSDTHLIAVENKIFHWVANPLGDYSFDLEKRCNNRQLIRIILSPFKIDETDLHGFRPVLYSELFSSIKQNIGVYIQNSDTKYLTYLIDFITTVENLSKGTTMDNQIVELILKNGDDIKSLMQQVNMFKAELRSKISELGGRITLEGKPVEVKQGFYREAGELYDCLYHDIKLSPELPIAIDCNIEASGWSIKIFVRSGGSIQELKTLLDKLEITYGYDGDRLEYKCDFPYTSDLEPIKDLVQSLIDKIADSSLNN